MTKVDFHILPTAQDSDLFSYVGRLTQKALSKNHQVLIATESGEQAKAVSQALWAFRPESFLSHTFVSDQAHAVQIGSETDCGDHRDILINLCPSSPVFFSRFSRVFEIVSQQPEKLAASRTRYKFYSERGYELSRHDLRDRV